MGIETLTKAADAAGYAMAGQDDEANAPVTRREPEYEPAPQARTTLPAVVQVQTEPSLSQWLRNAIGLNGRRAPA